MTTSKMAGNTLVRTRLVQTLSVEVESRVTFRRFGWSPDGSIFVAQVASTPNHNFAVWRSDTWEQIKEFGQKDRFQSNVHPYAGLAFDPQKRFVVMGAHHGLELRSIADFSLVHDLSGHVSDISWSGDGSKIIAVFNNGVKVIDVHKWKQLPGPNTKEAFSVARDSHRANLLIGCNDALELWDETRWQLKVRITKRLGTVIQIAWNESNGTFALGLHSKIAQIIDSETLTLKAELERHSAPIAGIAYSPDGRLLATASDDGQVCLWDAETYSILADINIPSERRDEIGKQGFASVAFHPNLPLIAVRNVLTRTIEIREFAIEKDSTVVPALDHLQYANAKVVLIGDTGVGKSGLSLALTGQTFKPTESTHGRHVWQFMDEKGATPRGILQTRETLLWDLAGQPGYRIVHQLHLQDTVVALLVFDSRSELDPFAGVRYWDRALRQASRLGSGVPLKKLLVAARIDRGGIGVSRERIDALIRELGIAGYFETSAKGDTGISELRNEIQASIDWDKLPTVSSNRLFQRIKSFIIHEKNAGTLLINLDDLYRRYKQDAGMPEATGGERDFETCVARMESRDLIRRLSFGNLLLLQPELLDAYASALVNAAKDEPDGMGHIAEEIALGGRFRLADDERINSKEQERLLLIATVEELLRHEIILREQTDGGPYLIFPSQFTREHPDLPDPHNQAIIFTFEGAVLSIYSTLVVRFSHTGFFKKKELWKNAAAFSSATGGNCGLTFREIGEGRAELVLFFEGNTSEETRFQFEEYVRSHLEKRALPNTVVRRRIFVCQNCETPISDLQATRRRERGENSISCNVCDSIVSLFDREERLKSIDPKMVDSLDRRADANRNLEAATAVLRGKIETQDFDVFLAHSSKDKALVEEIAQKLRARGVNPWLDKEQIPPGRWFQDVIQQVIPKVKSAAVFIGSKDIGPWEAVELRSFISQCVERKLPVIPVLLPNVLSFPPDLVFLRELNGVKFDSMKDQEAIDRFIWGITGQKPIVL